MFRCFADLGQESGNDVPTGKSEGNLSPSVYARAVYRKSRFSSVVLSKRVAGLSDAFRLASRYSSNCPHKTRASRFASTDRLGFLLDLRAIFVACLMKVSTSTALAALSK